MLNMSDAFSGLVQQAQFAIVRYVKQDGDTVESAEAVGTFLGSLQPLHPRDLNAKPEGWRKWKWFTLFTNANQELTVGDFVRDQRGIQYRVMSKSDWAANGAFNEYQIIQAPAIGSEAA